MKPLKVEIFHQTFELYSSEIDDEKILSLSHALHQKMMEMSEQTKQSDPLKVAILTTLNWMLEMQKEQEDLSRLDSSVASSKESMTTPPDPLLASRLESILVRLEKLVQIL